MSTVLNVFPTHLAARPKSKVKDPRVLLCFADGFMYEKSSEVYINGRPQQLDAYQKEFGDEDTNIADALEVKTCIGLGLDSHCFLGAEGYAVCSLCSRVMCQHCIADPEADSNNEPGVNVLDKGYRSTLADCLLRLKVCNACCQTLLNVTRNSSQAIHCIQHVLLSFDRELTSCECRQEIWVHQARRGTSYLRSGSSG